MVIQIARISAQSTRHCVWRSTAPQCLEPATWVLVDRDMPESHGANLGERACCTAHITATYLSLRGAHVVAQAPTATRIRVVRQGADRRRALRPVPFSSVGDDVRVRANGTV